MSKSLMVAVLLLSACAGPPPAATYSEGDPAESVAQGILNCPPDSETTTTTHADIGASNMSSVLSPEEARVWLLDYLRAEPRTHLYSGRLVRLDDWAANKMFVVRADDYTVSVFELSPDGREIAGEGHCIRP